MDDAIVAMAPFAAEREAAGFEIEIGAPFDQFANSLRRFAHDHLDDFSIAQLAAGGERVGDVILEAVFGIQHAGDAPLGLGAIRFLQLILAHHHDRKPRIGGNRRPQAGQSAADDQHVAKSVRHPLGMKRDQIAGRVFEHGRAIRGLRVVSNDVRF